PVVAYRLAVPCCAARGTLDPVNATRRRGQVKRRVRAALLLAQVEPDRLAPLHRLALAILSHLLGPCHDQIGPPVAVPVADAEPSDIHVPRGLDEELPLGQFG